MPVRCVTKTIGAAVAVPVLLGAGLVAGPVLGIRGLHRARKRYGKKKAYARRRQRQEDQIIKRARLPFWVQQRERERIGAMTPRRMGDGSDFGSDGGSDGGGGGGGGGGRVPRLLRALT